MKIVCNIYAIQIAKNIFRSFIIITEEYMMKIDNNDNISFGLTNNKAASRRVLKNVAPEKRKKIYNDIDTFCKLTQQRGIKGEFRLEGPNSFSVTPLQTGTKKLVKDAELTLNYFFAALDFKGLKHSQPFGTEFTKHGIFIRRIS